MVYRLSYSVIVLGLWVLIAGCSGEKFDLKFAPPADSEYELVLNLSGTVSFNLPIGPKQTQDFDVNIKTKIAFDSTSNSSTGMRFQYTSFGMPALNIDSSNTTNSENDKEEMLTDMFSKAFSTQMDLTGKCGSVQGFDSLIHALKAVVNAEISTNGTQLSPDSLITDEAFTGFLDLAFNSLPGHKVSLGDKWENNSNFNFGFPLTFNKRFTLESMSGDTAFLSVKSVVGSTNEQAVSAAGLQWFLPPMEGTNSVVKKTIDMLGNKLQIELEGTMDGSASINVYTGLPYHSQLNQQMQGKVKFNSFELPISLNLKYNFQLVPVEK